MAVTRRIFRVTVDFCFKVLILHIIYSVATIILGIETSCDDTAAAVLVDGKLCANIVSQQLEHQAHGGVIPELASRVHVQRIVPVVEAALSKANIDKKDLTAVAYTQGPGLLGSLLVGNAFSKSLALALAIPLIAVHHMQAHLLVHFIDDDYPTPTFPFLGLTVSGGHTQLVQVDGAASFTVLGQTKDDAAGEAFDKTGKMLGLPYPAGPLMDKYAKKGKAKFSFGKPTVEGLDFSFSGLKTSVLYYLREQQDKDSKFIEKNLYDLCASVQKAIVDILMEKVVNAFAKTGLNQLVLGGGVSANSELRKALENTTSNVFLPPLPYTTDNAAMIAMAGHLKLKENKIDSLESESKARIPI
ncbi:MAG: tRNA N6-adenosine threonylcarbamoyltransferase [Flavobacteriales bacterium]|nr:MAG: tRNA N6-adenosine threonylcarbamoyltransferase [Flavobacteriales bacterium]|tara:strand:- start:756 stop:1829 length:1074 start_codon:yes stop_codon:yes gene_type:complete